MSKYTDQDYLRDDQYRNSANLDARAAIHRRFSTNKQDWHAWVFDQLELPAQARVLELGCGPGWLWRSNSARIPTGWQVTLSDLSQGMVNEAEQALASSGRPFTCRVIDAQAIPYDDGYFDAVIANHMLYHVPDLDSALAEIARVLTPGGVLAAATNGAAHMRELTDLIRAFDPDAAALLGRETRLGFQLENGAELLAPHFSAVELRRFECDLAVTDAEAIIAYVRSMHSAADHADLSAKETGFRALVAERIAAEGGAMHITKATGLFLARKSG